MFDMTAKTLVQLTCDKQLQPNRPLRCGASVVLDADSRTYARLEALALGWRTIQVKSVFLDLCPDHDPVKSGDADEVNTSRTNARMKGYMDQRNARATVKPKRRAA